MPGKASQALAAFVAGVDPTLLDAALLEPVRESLRRLGDDDEVTDVELSEITKVFEIELRGEVEAFRGETLPPGRAGGNHLVAAAVDSQLIMGGPHPESLLYAADAVFAARRPAHHSRFTSRWTEFLLVFLAANETLTAVRQRARVNPHPIHMIFDPPSLRILRGDQAHFEVTGSDAQTGAPILGAQATARITFRDGSTVSSPMKFSQTEGRYALDFGTSAASPGHFTVVVVLDGPGVRVVSKNQLAGDILPR